MISLANEIRGVAQPLLLGKMDCLTLSHTIQTLNNMVADLRTGGLWFDPWLGQDSF